ASTPLDICLKAPRGQYDRSSLDFGRGAVNDRRCAVHPAVVGQEFGGSAVVEDSDPGIGGGLVFAFDPTWATADNLNGETAPESKAPVDLECLTPVGRSEAHTALGHPFQRLVTAADQHLHQLWIGPEFRYSLHVLVEFLSGIDTEVGGVDIFRR